MISFVRVHTKHTHTHTHTHTHKKRCEHRRNDVNTVVMFFSVRTKKLPFRLLQVRWLDTAGFDGFGIHAPTMVEPKRGGSAL
jgi:hypothetical protein